MSPFIVPFLVNFEPFSMAVVQSLMTTKPLFISFNHNEQVRSPVSSDQVIGVRVGRVEVVNVYELSSFVNYEFVCFVLNSHILMSLDYGSKNVLGLGHGFVPFS